MIWTRPSEDYSGMPDVRSEIEFVSDDIPLQKVKNIMVKIKEKDNYIDGYIDDLLTIILNIPNLIQR